MSTPSSAVRRAPASGRGLSGSAGFSLIELTVSTLLTLLVLGGLTSVLYSVQQGQADLQGQVDAQQAARIALIQIQRDLQVAGVGLSRLQPPFPVVVPRDDGGIELRVNRGQLTTFLDNDMSNPRDSLPVASLEGFEVGHNIAVYDSTGDIDLTTITAMARNRISHAGLSKAYTRADGTAVARVEIITYRADGDEAPFRLLREVDGADTAVVTDGLLDFELEYLDDSVPRVRFAPTTTDLQLRIRVIEVALTVQMANARLRDGTLPTFRLEAQVAPRSLLLF